MYRFRVQARFSSPNYTQSDWVTMSQHRTRPGAVESMARLREHCSPYLEYRILEVKDGA